MKIQLHKCDEVFFRLDAEMGQMLELKNFLTCFAPGYKHHPKYKARMWDGRISFFNAYNRKLPIGLMPEFLKFCKKYQYEYEAKFDVSELYTDITKDQLLKFTKDIMNRYGSKFELRDYQFEALYSCITNKRGIANLCTGAGKSLIIYNLIQFLRACKKKTLLIVPTTSLVEQMHSDFAEYGWSDLNNYVSKLYSGEKPNYDDPVLISTWQSIHKKDARFFEEYDAVIVDEAHGSKSASVKSILEKCSNADYRIGTTGTVPKEEADAFNVHGYLGPVIYHQGSKDLIDRGILSDIKIVNMLLQYPQEIVERNKNRSYFDELGAIYEYKGRNKVFDHIFDHMPDNQNTLILCHKIDHLNDIEEYLVEHLDDKYEIYTIHGDIKTSEREQIRQLMDQRSNVVLVSTYATMSTGVNIRRLHNVIFASSYKSEIKILQSIGRGLRKHESKGKMILWDLIDDLTWRKRTGTLGMNHVYKHWQERLKYYTEQGFEHVTTKFKV